ncbi:MAG: hypothetical protein B6241_14435 [Spirochaetaceae bacterium 4572_59]|nr:MAG: hypothetical protein B6241_14435 [Spirochaetaceae bacterium 4572_59]
MTFYSTLSTYYEEIFPYSEACGELLVTLLEKDQPMLDAGCGTAALVRNLRQKGIDARGFDLDREMIKLAGEYLLEELPGDSVNKGDVFRQGDLLSLDTVFPEKKFNLISCIGNTMAHIPREGLKVFLDSVFKMLHPGGYLILQTLNYRNAGFAGLPFPDIETPHCLFKRQYREDDTGNALLFETELTDLASAKSFKYSTKHFPSSQEELKLLLKERGFIGLEFFGSWKKDPVSLHLLPLIIKATRP